MPRIHHVSIEVSRDLTGQEVTFWEALGFVPVEAPDGISRSAVWLEAGDQQIHLLPVDGPSLPGSGHVALIADDLETTLEEVRRAVELGLGSALISERFNVKDAAVLTGAVGAASTTLGVATAATNIVRLANSAVIRLCGKPSAQPQNVRPGLA